MMNEMRVTYEIVGKWNRGSSLRLAGIKGDDDHFKMLNAIASITVKHDV